MKDPLQKYKHHFPTLNDLVTSLAEFVISEPAVEQMRFSRMDVKYAYGKLNLFDGLSERGNRLLWVETTDYRFRGELSKHNKMPTQTLAKHSTTDCSRG